MKEAEERFDNIRKDRGKRKKERGTCVHFRKNTASELKREKDLVKTLKCEFTISGLKKRSQKSITEKGKGGKAGGGNGLPLGIGLKGPSAVANLNSHVRQDKSSLTD